MPEIVVLAPTRGRPERAAEMMRTFRDTAVRIATGLVLVVDRDDPRLDDYLALPELSLAPRKAYPLWPADKVGIIVLEPEETGSLTAATNAAARRVWDEDCIIGHVGDDHAFRTPAWDNAIRDALAEPGVAYGDDLFQGPVLPTAVFMSSVIPRTLGWFALPRTRHMMIDTAWKELGERLGRLHYLPDVVIEHMHPAAGKAPEDEGYANGRESRLSDRGFYRYWQRRVAPKDVRRLRKAIA